MMNINVDGLMFTFPSSWEVSKYDEWAFYRKQFSKMYDGIKAVDLLAVESQVTWLIEVKDYRRSRRTKPSELPDEVAQKVSSTLAAMLPARVNASDLAERRFAEEVLKTTRLRVVLHLEQPSKGSKLYPRAFDPANVQLKLRIRIKPIDPHAMVVESSQMQGFSMDSDMIYGTSHKSCHCHPVQTATMAAINVMGRNPKRKVLT